MFLTRRLLHAAFLLVPTLAFVAIGGCNDEFWGGPQSGQPQHKRWDFPTTCNGVQPIRIASFNIQSFGPKKVADPKAMSVIVEIIRRFQIVAVQEVRSLDQTVTERLVEMVNADGRRYDFVLSPRLGRGSYKEQYAFIYDTDSISVDGNSIYTILDQADYFHREPLVATFYTKPPVGATPFSFTLINMHTDPDDVPAELSMLDDVVRGVAAQSAEDDVILIGDLNASPQNFGPLLELPNVSWALQKGQWTNTRRSNAYDNLLFNAVATAEFTGNAGVIDLREAFGLSLDQALRISDHMPIWAEFYPTEMAAGARVAAPVQYTH